MTLLSSTHGQCPQCGTGNPFTIAECDVCHSPLPWAAVQANVAQTANAGMVKVKGTTAELPRDLYERIMDLLYAGQVAKASQELQKGCPGISIPRSYEIITALNS